MGTSLKTFNANGTTSYSGDKKPPLAKETVFYLLI